MPSSNYLQAKLADHTVGKTAFTMPTNVYVTLCTAAPTDASTGTTITEAAYTSYARVQTSGTDWNAYAADLLDNANVITFPAATGGSETITHFCLCDASTAGNMLIYGTLDASLAVSTGITPSFAANALTLTIT
jgi:hypothetical protein